MKEFIGTCVDNPFRDLGKLCEIIESGRKVSRKKFFDTCNIEDELKKIMRKFVNDFCFFRSGDIWFYEWSAIEHFFE